MGAGWALEIESFFRPCEMASSRKASAIWGPKSFFGRRCSNLFVQSLKAELRAGVMSRPHFYHYIIADEELHGT